MTTFTNRWWLRRFDRWARRISRRMQWGPRSIRSDATLCEALDFLAAQGVIEAPVIDDNDRTNVVPIVRNDDRSLQSRTS